MIMIVATIVGSGTYYDAIGDYSYIDILRTTDSVEKKDGLTKIYNSSEKSLEIKDDKNAVLLDIKLTSPYNVWVTEDEDMKVAEFYLEDFSGDSLFDSISFYDIKDNYREKTKEYWFKYGTDYEVEECFDALEYEPKLKETTIICQNATRTNWTRFDSLDKLPKNIKIGLFTDTTGEKKVEWIPNIKGFDILEWADYEIVGLSTYNDTAGDYSIDGIRALAVSPDGNYLFTSSYLDDYVSIMNITNKSAIVPLATYNDSNSGYSVDQIMALAVSPDGNYLITSSYTDDYVSIMNITNKSAIVPLATYNDADNSYSVDQITALAVSPDGNYLITSSYTDNYTSIMNITNKSAIVPLATYNDVDGDYSIDGIRALAVSPDGNYLITSSYTDDYVSIMRIKDEPVDTTPPTYSDNSTNSTIAGTNIKHSLKWNDTVGLSGYIFSFDNGTGTLVNDSWVAFTTNPDWSNVTKTVNSTVGATIRWCVYANDTSNNWNNTGCATPFSYLTTSADTCSCPSPASNWAINMLDHCNITSACNNAGFNLTFTNGTTTDTINISSTIICDNINFNTTGYVFIDSDGYLNLT